MNNPSLHVLADRLSPPQIDRLILHTQRIKPDYINITGGARLDVAQSIIERIGVAAPDTKPILRFGNDDGLWKKMSVDAWYQQRIIPRLDWLRKNRVIVMPDNESLESDLHPYAKWMDDAILKCGDVKVAVGTFATGNPREDQYGQLDAMWQGLHDNGGIWRPHEYLAPTPAQSGGHLNRYMNGWKRCKELLNGWTPPTVIGELGLCGWNGSGLDPYKGFQRLGVSSGDYARNFIIPTFEAWYKSNGVTICVFCLGNWDNHGFDVDEAYLLAIEAYAQKAVDVPVKTKPAPVGKPEGATLAFHRLLSSKGVGRIVREGPGMDFEPRKTIFNGQELKAFNPFQKDDSGAQWAWIECNEVNGWMCIDNVQWVPLPVPPLPTVEPTRAPVIPIDEPPPALDDTQPPVVTVYKIPVLVEVKATSAEAAQTVAEFAMVTTKTAFNAVVQAEKLRNYLAANAILDATFTVQLPIKES